MARKFDNDDLERLKKNISIEELCRSRGIELRKKGARDLVGKCPFHEDKNPSFVVTPDKNLFHCLGCNAGGSVIDLVMKLDCLTFREATDKLLTASPAIRRAADLQSKTQNPKLIISPEKANTLLEKVIAVYEKTFAEDLAGPSSPKGFAGGAKAYLEKRGITDAGLFSCHRVGYASGKLKDLLPSDGKVRDELKAIGVLLENPSTGSGQVVQERFAGCVTFPVYGPDGQLVTIYGRYIQDGLKRHVYLPDRSTGLWNSVAVKTYSEVILVESIIDALSVMMAGHRNVIAIQGTNGFDEADIRTLNTYGVQSVALLLDGDEAGKNATARLKEKLSSSFSCRVISLPEGLDPNACLQSNGPESLATLLQTVSAESGSSLPVSSSSGPGANRTEQGAVPAPPDGDSLSRPLASFVVNTLSNTLSFGLRKYRIMGLEKGPRKLKATIRVEHAGKLHVDTLDFYSAKSRRILAQDLCRIFEEMPETIEGDLDKLLRHCESLPEASLTVPCLLTPEKTISPKDRAEAETFGKSSTLFEDILADCEKRGLMGERNNVLLLYVAMTSRKRDTPLSVLILSSSGSGKTALQDAVLAFCPPEDLVKLTSLSGKALFYKDRLSLKNKVLALEEGDGAEEAMYAIRNLISAGELVSESTIKDLTTGRLTTMENKVEGPSTVCFTTTKPDVDPETKSRFWVTSIDESRDQTRKILLFQRQQHLSDGLITSPEIEAILRKHRNFQRLLKPLAVKNPYAAQLTYGDDRLQGRRDQPKYLNLIKAIAFLRQMQKPLCGSDVPCIEVDRTDIKLANQLAHEILGHSLDELSRPGSDLLQQLEAMAKARLETLLKENPDSKTRTTDLSFSRRDIREFTGWSNARVHRYLKELLELEYVLLDSGRNGTLCRYRLAYEGQGKDGKRFMLGLIDPDKLQEPKQ